MRGVTGGLPHSLWSKSEVEQPKTESLIGFRIGGRLEGALEFLHGQSSIAHEATESAPLQRISCKGTLNEGRPGQHIRHASPSALPAHSRASRRPLLAPCRRQPATRALNMVSSIVRVLVGVGSSEIPLPNSAVDSKWYSRAFVTSSYASTSVSPCLTTPGTPGIVATYPLSSGSANTAAMNLRVMLGPSYLPPPTTSNVSPIVPQQAFLTVA
jgi:hypothetical protein